MGGKPAPHACQAAGAGGRGGAGHALLPIRPGSLCSNSLELTLLVRATEAERSVGRPHREEQDCGAGTLIGRRLHSLEAPGLCTAAQDARAIHCSQQKVLGRSLCHPPGPQPRDGPGSLESQTPRVEGPCGPAPWVRTEGGELSPGPKSLGNQQVWSPRPWALDPFGLLPGCHPVPFPPISSWPWALSPGISGPSSRLCKAHFNTLLR